ncbi:MAG: hypothetical protein H0W68_01840, partial [Gemmatimonadaceae bacterium]|nr:hypothetical protein [Gemmatimonadaceae bacterium]
MTRRRVVALVALGIFIAVGTLVVGTLLVGTKSESGQAGLRRWLERRIAARIDGRVHIGRIGGNFLTGLSIDSLELRDDEDSLVVATGRIALAFDAREFASRRLYFSRVEVAHAQIVLRQHQDWQWNFKRLFRVGREPQAPPGPEGGFGDFIVADSVRLTGNASLRVTIPWHPDDSLHG